MPSASVIIPFKNEQNHLPLLLKCISDSLQYYSDIEVILVNNCSVDKSPEIARNFVGLAACAAKVIDATPANRSVARNQGAKVATSNLLIFMDADCTFKPESMKNLISEMQNLDSLCALQGKFDLDRLHNHLSKNFLDTKCVAVRLDAFNAVDGFDQSLTRCEDIDFSWKLSKCNLQFGISNQALFSRSAPNSLVNSMLRGVATGRALVALHKKWGVVEQYSVLKLMRGFIDIGMRELNRTARISSAYSKICLLADNITTLVCYLFYRIIYRF